MATNELTNRENDQRIPTGPEADTDQPKPAAVTNREYQSTIFTSYFGEAGNAALLYEGMKWLETRGKDRDGTEAEDPVRPEDVVFETLEGVLYLARKNDLAFTVKRKVLVIGEHQSTVNENMPLRSAIYYGRTMEKIIEPRAIYKSKKVPIPTPEFYVFYNGKEAQPLEQTLYLSDSYLEQTDHPMLQLKVKVININLSEKHPILEKCRPLYEYSWFLGKVREYSDEGESRDEAIKKAMEASVREGILTEFIARHGSEVRNMLFTEFNLEDARDVWKEEAREEGWLKGLTEGRIAGQIEGRRAGQIEGRREGQIEGRREGQAEGAEYALIEQISKKMKKGKSLETIAEELEADVEKVRDICKSAEAFAPDYDPQAIFRARHDDVLPEPH